MNDRLTLNRLNVVVFSLLLVGQSMCAGIGETLCALKERTSSTTAALATLGGVCCGLAYWNIRLQRKQSVLKKAVAYEQKQRTQLQTTLSELKAQVAGLAGSSAEQHQGLLIVGAGLTQMQQECDERLKPIENAIYGFGTDHSHQAFRLTCLAKMIENQSHIKTVTVGRIQFGSSEESELKASGSQSSIHQSDENILSPQDDSAQSTPDLTLALPTNKNVGKEQSNTGFSCFIM